MINSGLKSQNSWRREIFSYSSSCKQATLELSESERGWDRSLKSWQYSFRVLNMESEFFRILLRWVFGGGTKAANRGIVVGLICIQLATAFWNEKC